MTEKQIFLTREKKKELEAELTYLKTEKRSEILDRLAFAKSLGDLSENAEYHTSKEDQGKNEARINEIEHTLKYAVMVEANTDGTIGLGSLVVLTKKDTGEERAYTIVGAEESDVLAAKMSFDSPIGRALMNKKQGEVVKVETPKGEVTYTITSVK